jgi:uncharacterized Ntn-hydrolase superfamily protein
MAHGSRPRAFRILFFLAIPIVFASPASATWSVIALDRDSGTVAIASATCVPQARLEGFPARDLRDIQAIVVPGVGVAAAQAGVDRTRANQKLIFAELVKGTPPADVIAMLKKDEAIASRQFGILDMHGRAAGFSGEKNGKSSLDRQGQVAGTRIHYSIQGNILTSDEVVESAVKAFEAAKGSLTDRVMAAMEAADAKGGDSRCTCATEPRVEAPCDGKTSHVAYILRADKTDKNGESFNDGSYAMYISVTDKDIKPAENANPVKTLRMRYDAAQGRK